MRVVVIGATGFVGRHTLAYLRSLGHDVLGTCSSGPRDGLINFDLLRQRITGCVPASFFEPGAPVIGLIGAAITQIDRCAREPEFSQRVNVDGTIRLIDDLVAQGAKPVYLSSSFVFDGSVGYYPDDYPHSPISVYGRHKSAVEQYVREHVPDGLVLRLDKIVGDDPSERHLFSEWWGWVTAGRPIVCIDQQIISPTWVADVAKAIGLACERQLTGVYNTANTELYSRAELAKQFLDAIGREGQIVCRSQEALGFLNLRPLKSSLDSARFIEATGMRWTPMREVFRRFMKRLDRKPDGAERTVHYEGARQ